MTEDSVNRARLWTERWVCGTIGCTSPFAEFWTWPAALCNRLFARSAIVEEGP